MRFLTRTLCVFSLLLFSCVTTPFQIGTLSEKNTEVKELFMACSDGANFTPNKPGCQPNLLEAQTRNTLTFAKNFISADIKQPQGYDVYLSVALIYFRIGERNVDAYSEAERIARQFFEMQKVSSGRSLTDARFYWAAFCSAEAAWMWFNDPFLLDAEKKSDLLMCYAEGNKALQSIESGPRKIRLQQYLKVIKGITETM